MSMKPIVDAIGSSTTGAKELIASNTLRDPEVLELDAALTIRQAASLKERLLAAMAAADAVELSIRPGSEADLSFIQLIESARIHASLHSKQLRLATPAAGQILETLQRSGLTSAMSSESRAFWLHEKEIR